MLLNMPRIGSIIWWNENQKIVFLPFFLIRGIYKLFFCLKTKYNRRWLNAHLFRFKINKINNKINTNKIAIYINNNFWIRLSTLASHYQSFLIGWSITFATEDVFPLKTKFVVAVLLLLLLLLTRIKKSTIQSATFMFIGVCRVEWVIWWIKWKREEGEIS